MRLLFFIIASGLLCAGRARAAPPSGAGWDLAWNDEFNGTSMDPTKWNHWLPGARRDAVNSPGAVSVGNGNLTISTYTSGGTHYTGMIATQNTYLYTYGYLEARINYDSAPGMWSAFWMQAPSMGNPIGLPNTTVTFDQPGSYALRLAAANANGETSRMLTVTVLSNLESWRQTHFGTTLNTGSAADTFDANGDGELNLLEFATAQNPNAATLAKPTLVKNGATLEFTYSRSVAAMRDGVTFTAEWSDTLAAGSWSSAGVTEQIRSDNGTVQSVRASLSAGAGGRRFLRLKISKP